MLLVASQPPHNLHPAYVCVSVCPSVCLSLAGNSGKIDSDSDFTEFPDDTGVIPRRTVLTNTVYVHCVYRSIELRFCVPPDMKQVISETFSWLGTANSARSHVTDCEEVTRQN